MVKRRLALVSILTLILAVAGVYMVYAEWTPLPVDQDPLVRLPGTQPGQVVLEGPNRCLNCHADYNAQVEPGFNWKGSMMAQAARDYLFWATMAVAGQDSIWAVGRPNAMDLCERCHFPQGWLDGRSDPPNASAMIGADYDGVHCDTCHTMYDPFFVTTHNGTREGDDWLNYWDETNASGTPSQPAADTARAEDAGHAQAITFFNGNPFYGEDDLPVSPDYVENGAGQFFVSGDGAKRASFADATARHGMSYSRYNKSKYFCGSCHDVSNPVLANLAFEGTPPGDGTTILTSESQPAYAYFHVERTFSEFMLSDYGQQGGAAGIGPFAPDLFDTSDPNNHIRMCQDCHMRDVVGKGANKNNAVLRPTNSIEHPNSGQPLHDLTGGSSWIATVLASTVPGSPNYDGTNADLLNGLYGPLTLDLTQGEGIDAEALLAGADRAQQQLLLAASIEDLAYNTNTGALSFRIQNHTGHKLISGYPEGRRMFLNIRAYDAAQTLIYEVNPYDVEAGTLKGLDYDYQDGFGLPDPLPLDGDSEEYEDELNYESHPSSSLTGEDEQSFHFALADDRYKDNRIPPKGFRVAEAGERLSLPVHHGVPEDPASPFIYTPEEYAGGYDQVSLYIPPGADSVEVSLYYQTTSREYVEFLRDEINGNADNQTLPDPDPSTPDINEAYIIQTDPFFDGLAAWGDTIWDLWVHNRNDPGAAPFLMVRATTGGGDPCPAPVPTLLSADPAHQQVTLNWSDEYANDPNVTGYKVYYDQAGKAQLIAGVGPEHPSYVDDGLTNGEEYCYKVTSLYAGCESGYSNIQSAVPSNNQSWAGVTQMVTGFFYRPGGTWVFVPTDTFSPGDYVFVLARVFDQDAGLPLAGAVVEMAITGPESVDRTSGPSTAGGWAIAVWLTQAGTPPGSYLTTVTNVIREGYMWDGFPTNVTFTIQ